MRTDLRLNYSQLEQVAERIGSYAKAIENMEDALDDMKSFLGSQETESTDKLKEKIKNVKMDMNDKAETLSSLKNTLDSYINGMRHYVREEYSGQTRVDTLDIDWNLGQIESAVTELNYSVCSPVSGGFYVGLGEGAKEKRRKQERNYRKLEDYRSGLLMGLVARLRNNADSIRNIYNSYLKPYEQLDDSYRSTLNGIYDKSTSSKDKWNNFWDSFGKVSKAFLENLVTAAVITCALVMLPGTLVAGLLVVAAAGCVIMTSVPEENVPNWLKGAKKTADGVKEKALEVMKDGPIVLVEDIGQGLMDTVQTPEGIAALAGQTVGSAAGVKMGRNMKSNIKPKTTKVDGSKGASGANSLFDKGKDVFKKFNPNDAYVKPKHLSTSGGNGAKFLGGSKVESEVILREGLKNGTIKTIADNGITKLGSQSYEIIVDAGKVVGTKGETLIKVVLSEDGGMLSAYPVK